MLSDFRETKIVSKRPFDYAQDEAYCAQGDLCIIHRVGVTQSSLMLSDFREAKIVSKRPSTTLRMKYVVLRMKHIFGSG
jgi:hypothetical protein